MDVKCSSLKPSRYYLQACTKNLQSMESFVCKNHFPTKSPAEVKDESNAPECPVILIHLPPPKMKRIMLIANTDMKYRVSSHASYCLK